MKAFLEPRQIDQAVTYALFREALAHFCRLIELEKPDDYFPGVSQTKLFPEGDL